MSHDYPICVGCKQTKILSQDAVENFGLNYCVDCWNAVKERSKKIQQEREEQGKKNHPSSAQLKAFKKANPQFKFGNFITRKFNEKRLKK